MRVKNKSMCKATNSTNTEKHLHFAKTVQHIELLISCVSTKTIFWHHPTLSWCMNCAYIINNRNMIHSNVWITSRLMNLIYSNRKRNRLIRRSIDSERHRCGLITNRNVDSDKLLWNLPVSQSYLSLSSVPYLSRTWKIIVMLLKNRKQMWASNVSDFRRK